MILLNLPLFNSTKRVLKENDSLSNQSIKVWSTINTAFYLIYA